MQKTALCALACVAAGYFIGCINPAFIIGRIKGYDVRSSGSKNAGASNTVIMAGKLAGVLVALLDIFKAALSWRLCQALFPQFALAGILGGVACILGHMFPVFLHFCGGKGLACIGGVVLAARYFCPFYIFLSVMHELAGTVRGAGKSIPPMVILLTSLCVLRIIWLKLLLPVYNSIDIVYASYPTTWAIGMLLMILYVWKSKWLTARNNL